MAPSGASRRKQPPSSSAGSKVGGNVEQHVHVLEVTCLPSELPEIIEVDISELQIGEALHIGDLKLAKGVIPTHGADVVIVNIAKPRVEEETAPE